MTSCAFSTPLTGSDWRPNCTTWCQAWRHCPRFPQRFRIRSFCFAFCTNELKLRPILDVRLLTYSSRKKDYLGAQTLCRGGSAVGTYFRAHGSTVQTTFATPCTRKKNDFVKITIFRQQFFLL